MQKTAAAKADKAAAAKACGSAPQGGSGSGFSTERLGSCSDTLRTLNALAAPLPAEEKKENVAVPATSSTAGVGTAISPSAPSTQNASPSLYASLYGSPDEEYDPAKPNDYDEFCRRQAAGKLRQWRNLQCDGDKLLKVPIAVGANEGERARNYFLPMGSAPGYDQSELVLVA
ncbi:unnamed protein product [Prorocentrum cordatum]|uniref:Uncharacterized protein n=1 Tax=Prorocentrum cordatum TaxID=2364126 RepID=A0ABN9ULP3_9DINO|nr:unnamed protein product [Polarella glacialis]